MKLSLFQTLLFGAFILLDFATAAEPQKLRGTNVEAVNDGVTLKNERRDMQAVGEFGGGANIEDLDIELSFLNGLLLFILEFTGNFGGGGFFCFGSFC